MTLKKKKKKQPTSLASSASLPAVLVFSVSGKEAENFCSNQERYLGGFAGAEHRSEISSDAIAQL